MGALFTQSGNKGVVILEGDLTMPYAEEIRKILMKAIRGADELSVAFKNVRDADLSCLQLLCSAHRSAVRMKKHMTFTGIVPQTFKDTVVAAGFSHIRGCGPDSGRKCLWKLLAGGVNE